MNLSELKITLSQIRALAEANMKARYRKTIAGFIWVIINPIILFSAQSIVFKYFLKLDIDNYFTFMLGGLIPWTFLNSTITMGTPALQRSRDLLKAFKINPLVLVLSQVFDNGINFIFTFFILSVPVYILSDIFLPGLLFFPLALAFMIISLGSLVWILSIPHIFFRDTTFVMSFILNIMFFLTPIFYSESFIPEKFRWLLNLNIFYTMIKPFRIAIYEFNFNEMIFSLSHSLFLSMALLCLATYTWKKGKNDLFAQL